MSDQAILRITREIKQIQQGSDLSLAVACQDSDIRKVQALVVGPPETPYEFGFFEFSIKFGRNYPAHPPTVQAVTTNGGRCRFNPNIYASGKVCLSILGTWRGESGEQWSSAQGLESVLISIQSLMSSNPYENEPGYENATSSKDKRNMTSYVAKIRHESLRLAVIAPLEASLGIRPDGTVVPPDVDDEEEGGDRDADDDDSFSSEDEEFRPFFDVRKRRFLWYYESYVRSIDKAEPEVRAQQRFERMPFEGEGNTMDGHFDYPELRRRISLIRKTILDETHRWASQGKVALLREAGIAVNLQRQYEQIREDLKRRNHFTIDLNLSEANPFVWELTYFGRPMTKLDGGIFRIRIHLSPRFPDEQPRVFVETALFHCRVSRDGVLCYFPKRLEEMRSHIEAIVAALEEDEPPYDPRITVHPEASRLFWGSPDDRKQYNRLLRRSVERSAEDVF
ncbi:hypothetical protein ASPZODRAFT_133226 [Penicilliopsis zonata CBS 506.65]|uniref:Ubiquitin-conjugating enzyme E2 Z n=1 Tax=Penicilliopsis zonata CBS 506.65 TaxID=1073090 RepID=A0A1L9SGG2_9EURO|nr:hypothetical protein ASPZODRAFT_133226 [Penicilliopsis zonata CBS 506.65]OJJ46218.1 hypothetical protein ASPZODRAFT_133226 [Penicilliopsis zonata CBS 506.65]